jgi:multimeric flavodoxin WrbA
MNKEGVVLGLVGSPNPKGRTNDLVTAAMEGASRAGAAVELIQMADYVVAPCRDCLPWTCITNLECNFEDEAFTFLSQKILNCGALVLGTPVYWWDTSGMIKYFILKMFRVFARSAPLKGLPAFGLAIAGGTGNGLISGLRPVYHFFQVMQMRAIEPLPVTRFNFQESLKRAEELGRTLTEMIPWQASFTSLEERLLWYDDLPFLGLNRAAERRFLADLTTLAQPAGQEAESARGLIQADVLAASGRVSESQNEVTRVYEMGVKIFEKK